MGDTWKVGGGRGGGGQGARPAAASAAAVHDERRATVRAGGIVESTEKSMVAAAEGSVPLKVMVFVDGTWLYYSFFGRSVERGGSFAGGGGYSWHRMPYL